MMLDTMIFGHSLITGKIQHYHFKCNYLKNKNCIFIESLESKSSFVHFQKEISLTALKGVVT